MDNTVKKSTHGAGLEYIGSDGVKRKLNVSQFECGKIQIGLCTYWDGPGKDATVTTITLGIEAMSQLANLMIEFMTNRDQYETKHGES